jgi:hypothetical protein
MSQPNPSLNAWWYFAFAMFPLGSCFAQIALLQASTSGDWWMGFAFGMFLVVAAWLAARSCKDAWSLYGFGTQFYGHRQQSSGGYIATKYLVIWWIPFLPVRSYLVQQEATAISVEPTERRYLTSYQISESNVGWLGICWPQAILTVLVQWMFVLSFNACGIYAALHPAH